MPELNPEEREAGAESVTAAAAASPSVPAQAQAQADEQEQTLHLERSEVEAGLALARPTRLMPGNLPAAVRTASLMVRSGPDTGAKFALDRGRLYFGRGADNDFVVDDPATSRRHARFERRGEEFLVVDLGSSNGTLVDGVRVVDRVLVTGAVITMGQNELVVSIGQEPG